MATRPASLPPSPRSRLSIQHRPTYAFVRCIFMRLIIFFLFPSSSLCSLFIPLRLDYGFTAVTRLPRSLSPVQGMQNKSGPFSARLPSAIVFFPLPPPPIVKYQRFSFSLLSSLSFLFFSRKNVEDEGEEGREGGDRRKKVVRKLKGKARVERANGVS